MKRVHIHISVENLEKSVGFYSDLFGAEPTKLKTDYAKWMLDDPRINFAISTRGEKKGLDHMGIQVDSGEELSEIIQRLERAERRIFDQGVTECCYSKSNKAWVEDPNGIAWEAYENMGDVEIFSLKSSHSEGACCAPKKAEKSSCC